MSFGHFLVGFSTISTRGGGAGVWGVISLKELLRCMLYLLYKIDVAYFFEINI